MAKEDDCICRTNELKDGTVENSKTRMSKCELSGCAKDNSSIPRPIKDPTNGTDHHELCVIGAGLMRTGTSSLRESLEMLYGKPCYHMSKVFHQLKQKHIKLWLAKFNNPVTNSSSSTSTDREFWSTVYNGYYSAVDYPTCAFYKELLHVYPNAKIILSIRDNPEEWVASCKATILSTQMLHHPNLGERLVFWWYGVRNLTDLHDVMFRRTLGPGYARMTERELAMAYERWNAEVKATVPTDRLLVYRARDGWDPLCKFLGRPIPNGVPFPHANTRETMRKNLSQLASRARLANNALFVLYVAVSLVVLLLIR